MPFFMIIFLVVIIVFGWRTLNTFLIDDSRDTKSERVFLDIENGSVKAMAADSGEWKGIPNKIYLYRGEKVRTGVDGRATLTFFNESQLRLNKESEAHLLALKRKRDIDTVDLYLPEGDFWAGIKTLDDPDSSFQLKTDLLSVTSRGGVLAITAPGTVYMIEGSSQINVMQGGEVLKNYTLGVGQQFMIAQEGVEKLTGNQEVDVIFAMSDTFKQSDWYRWNMIKDGAMISTEVSGEEPTEEGGATDEEATDEGTADEADTDSTEVAATSDGEENEEETPLDPTDKTPPLMPVITEPGKNGDTIALEEVNQDIAGTVSADTYKVIVNDYELQLYTPGSETFRYTARTTYGNLKVGDNEFKVYAKDRNGNVSEPAVITLALTQEVLDANPVETETESGSAAAGSGGVSIQEPNAGKDFTTNETEFDIKGIVPANTAKVVVNDYTLSKFQEGETAWTYKAYKSLGSLKIGSKNTYTVKAYDAEGDLLGSASIIIDVESQGAPVITIPTTRTSYLTTLDELVIGGTVGKWVQAVYVNDKKLLNYIPGSEKWQHTIILDPGLNVITVHGRTDSVNTASDKIEITFKP
ncbi:MAG: FecR domain-containing protein [Candidatus Peregrinibacteria bacterium]